MSLYRGVNNGNNALTRTAVRRRSSDESILADQIRLLYGQQPLGLIATLLNMGLAGWALWGEVSSKLIGPWLCLGLLVTTGRYWLVRIYRKAAVPRNDLLIWGRRFVVGAFFGGCCWGMLGGLLWPHHNTILQAFIGFTLAGMTAGAMSSMSSYIQAFRAFLFPALAPYALRLYLEGERAALIMCLMVLIFQAMLWLMSLRQHRALLESFRLRYANLRLTHDLSAANQQKAVLHFELEEEMQEHQRTEAAYRSHTELYKSLVESTKIGYVVVDSKGRVQDANVSYLKLTGRPRIDAILGNSIFEWTAAHDLARLQHALNAGFSSGATVHMEIEHLQPDGESVPVEMNGTVHCNADGEAIHLMLLVRNITGRKTAERLLQTSHSELETGLTPGAAELGDAIAAIEHEKETFRVTLASIGDAVITTDASARISYINIAAERLTGWRDEDAHDRTVSEVFRHSTEQSDIAGKELDVIEQCIASGVGVGPGFECTLTRRDGTELGIDTAVAPIRDRKNNIVGAVITFRDVTAQRELTQQLAHRATHDALTGLVNRYEFEQRLTHVAATAHPVYPHALLYIDLDRFKIVNDTCGHLAGDDLLQKLSGLLRSRLRSRDTFARLGGDEFGVMLEHCPMIEALRIANNLRSLVYAFDYKCEGRSFRLGASIGLVMITSAGHSASSILKAADSACYAAKNEGRDRVHVCQSDEIDASDTVTRRRLKPSPNEIAISEARMCLYCQPTVDLTASDVGGQNYTELLLRLRDEDGRIIAPSAFLPAAEEHDQMLAIDRWVTTETLALIRGDAEGLERPVYAINVSNQSLRGQAFLDFVLELLDAQGDAASQLCFEIKANADNNDLVTTARFVKTLRERGCRVTLEHVGTELSSINYLEDLQIDFLKFGGGFVRDMYRNRTDRAFVEGMHHVGHALGLKTVATWVENDLVLTKLREIGVDYAQGYAICEPRPLDRVPWSAKQAR